MKKKSRKAARAGHGAKLPKASIGKKRPPRASVLRDDDVLIFDRGVPAHQRPYTQVAFDDVLQPNPILEYHDDTLDVEIMASPVGPSFNCAHGCLGLLYHMEGLEVHAWDCPWWTREGKDCTPFDTPGVLRAAMEGRDLPKEQGWAK